METQSTTTQAMGHQITRLGWGDCYNAAGRIVQFWKDDANITSLYGIPRGGCMAALLVQSLAHRDGKFWPILDQPVAGTLVLDDIVDSGRTIQRYGGHFTDALFCRPGCTLVPAATVQTGWLEFPWEINEAGPEECVVRLLEYIGEDPMRNGLLDTPKRVLKAWTELTAGYQQDPRKILGICFDQPHDELVLLRGIEFHSTCEHHLLPFYGTAAVGYIPSKRVVGISKLARVVDCFARRLQIQERLTNQITDAITEVLDPLGVGVVLKAKHSCMGCRGVMKPDSDMVTSVMRGALRDNMAARAEFLNLVKL